MTALGGPSEADDERASAAPPVQMESKVCKFSVPMIQCFALELFNNLAHYLLGENAIELVSKCAFHKVRQVSFLSRGLSLIKAN